MGKDNVLRVYTTSSGAELNVSTSDMQQVVSATNNRAQYFAEQAKKFRDEAKLHSDHAEYYAKQNSDVTVDSVNNLKAELLHEIGKKQNAGDYALKQELPNSVSELENDVGYVDKTELTEAMQQLELPSQEGCAGKVLVSDGQQESWIGIATFKMFDTKTSDHVLTGEEAVGWALQGTYVTKNTYPDFYNKCLERKNSALEITYSLRNSEILIYRHSNGQYFYNIEDKSFIDDVFNTYGVADFYGIDTDNEVILLPRNKYFMQLTVNTESVNTINDAGLPNIEGSVAIHAPCSGQAGAFTADNTNVARLGGEQGNSVAILNFDASNVNSVFGKSSTVQPPSSNKLLYYCVGNTIVNEAIIDVANVVSDINFLDSKKLNLDHSNDTNPYITESYINGNSWYRVWSDGWCEQGGQLPSATNNISVVLLVTMLNDEYTIFTKNIATSYSSNASSGNKNTIAGYSAIVYAQTKNGFSVRTTNEITITKVSWYVAGYKE